MAQHDFVPAWLSFSTPQPSKSPAATFEKHGEHLNRGEVRFGGNRRRHNSSDGFFNNGPLRTPGDGWHQPSLLRHDSVDSGVSKGVHLGTVTSQGWKDNPGWHGQRHDPVNQRSGSSSSGSNGGSGTGGGNGGNGVGGNGGGSSSSGHRHWNGNFHPRKNTAFQDKTSTETKEEKKEEKEEKLQFVEEDFPSLNPEAGKQNVQSKTVGTPAGVWENPPSAKQGVSKMLVIKKVSKEDPAAAFSAGFISSGPLPTNVKTIAVGPSVYKNLVPKPAALSTKPGPWKPNRSEAKPGLFFPGRDSAFTSPVSATSPVVQANGSVQTSPKESPSSTTPPIEIIPSRLMKLTKRSTDKKSEFLKALKDGRSEDISEHGEVLEPRELDKLDEIESSSPETKENGDEQCRHRNGLSVSPDDGTDHLSSSLEVDHLSHSLEAEHRLLKAMGWQEDSENEENYRPITEDELREFEAKTEQWRKSFDKNGLLKGRSAAFFSPWKSTFRFGLSEDYDTETSSSSETSDDDV